MKKRYLPAMVLGGIAGGTLLGYTVGKIIEDFKLRRIWRSLEAAPTGEVFREDMVDGLPEPAQRYFLHTIRPGTRLASSVRLRMSGKIRPARNMQWLPFTASQILTPGRGFVWKATAKFGPISLKGADHYAGGSGQTRFGLFGLFPMVNASGPDVSRSAMGRLNSESVLVPSVLLLQRGVAWEALDDTHVKAMWESEDETASVMLTVDATGMLREVVIQRYGNQTEGGEYAYIPFGVVMDEEGVFDGYTIPSRLRAGWWYGTERYNEFIHIQIEQALFS